jgi:hypothetical protein
MGTVFGFIQMLRNRYEPSVMGPDVTLHVVCSFFIIGIYRKVQFRSGGRIRQSNLEVMSTISCFAFGLFFIALRFLDRF